MAAAAAGVDVTDVNTEQPDKKSIMMYLTCCYEVLTTIKNPIDNVIIDSNAIIKFK